MVNVSLGPSPSYFATVRRTLQAQKEIWVTDPSLIADHKILIPLGITPLLR